MLEEARRDRPVAVPPGWPACFLRGSRPRPGRPARGAGPPGRRPARARGRPPPRRSPSRPASQGPGGAPVSRWGRSRPDRGPGAPRPGRRRRRARARRGRRGRARGSPGAAGRRRSAAAPPGRSRGGREHPGQRDAAVVEHVGVQHDLVGTGVVDPRHVLDGELDAGELALPAPLDVLHRVEHEVVELLRAGAGERHLGRDEASSQATAVSVAAGGPGTAGGRATHLGAEPTTRGAVRGRSAPVSVPTGSSCRMGRADRFSGVPDANHPRAGLLSPA